jgi:SH3-like domain-containing protein
MTYYEVFGRVGGAILLLVTFCSPALAWQTSLQFGARASIPARVDSLEGPPVRLKPSGDTVEVKNCTRSPLPDCKISWEGRHVWISAAWLEGVDMTFASQTPIRAHPSRSANSKGIIPASSIVLVHECKVGWCKVSWEAEKGWVDRDDLYMNINTDGDR